MANILVKRGEKTLSFPIPQNKFFIIGRGNDCNIRIKLQTISRRHTQIRYEKGTYFVTDLGTSNGTYVNGEEIIEHALEDKDKIRVGKVEMIFALDEEERKKALQDKKESEDRDENGEKDDLSAETADVDMHNLLASLPDASDYTADISMEKLLGMGGEIAQKKEKKKYIIWAAGGGGGLILFILILVIFIPSSKPVEVLRIFNMTVDEIKVYQIPKYSKLINDTPKTIDIKEYSGKDSIQVIALVQGNGSVTLIFENDIKKKVYFIIQQDEFAEDCVEIQKNYQHLSEIQLQEMASKLSEDAKSLFDQRKVDAGNLYRAKMHLYKASCILDLIEGIKPPIYKVIQENRKLYEEELKKEYDLHWFNFQQAQNLDQWNIVKQELLYLMDLIPNRKDKDYIKARQFYEVYQQKRYF